MPYYIKEGQSSVWFKIKFLKDECYIPKINSNLKRTEKIVRRLKKNNINNIVLSQKIKEHKEFIEMLKNYDITIFDSRWLMQYLVCNIISYLTQNKKIDELAVLVNDLTIETKENIEKFADIYKRIRIVTNHLEKFKKIEEELYEKNGASIIITKNKRKALAKSGVIINFDFPEENLNQYNINENAIIINLNGKIKINKKRFSGTIITDYEVEIEPDNKEIESKFIDDINKKQTEFYLKEIIEEKIYSESKKKPNYSVFEIVESFTKKYNISIKGLYGVNGLIM